MWDDLLLRAPEKSGDLRYLPSALWPQPAAGALSSINALRVLWIATLSGNPPRCRRPGIIKHSPTTAIEFVGLVVRPRHVAALTDITQRAPIVVAFGKRARFVELGVCQYHQRFSDSTYRNAGVWHRAVARQAFGSVHIPRDLSIDKPRCRWRVPVLDLDPVRRAARTIGPMSAFGEMPSGAIICPLRGQHYRTSLTATMISTTASIIRST